MFVLCVTEFNDLTGPLPTTLSSLTSCRSLYLDHNRLTGFVPSVLPVSITYLQLQENLLHGSIPPALEKLYNLDTLILTNNSFSGTIPQFIKKLTTLRM